MSSANILLVTLGAVFILWIGLSIWRISGARQMDLIEQSYRDYYEQHTGENPPPVEWDFKQKKLIPIPEEDVEYIERSGGLQVMTVRSREREFPLSAYGIILARIPAAWFHGLIALVTVALIGLIVKYRA